MAYEISNLRRKVVLGTVQFGCQYGINSAGRPNQQAVCDILKEAQNSGISTLDTSSAYGNAEVILGECGTDGFRVVSKFPKGNVSVKDRFNLSLQYLNKTKLFGYLMHHFDVYRENSAIWDEFKRLRDERKVEKIGFSLYLPEELELLLNNKVDFTILQLPYNLFDRKFEPYLEELHKQGVEIHVRSTFLQGLFFKDRSTLPEKLLPMRKYLEELDKYAGTTGLSIAEIALNYNLHNPNIDGVLIGVDNVEQLQANIASIKDIQIDLDIDVKEKELLNPVNWK